MVLNSSVQSKDFNLNKYKAKFRSIYLNYNLFNRPPVGRYDRMNSLSTVKSLPNHQNQQKFTFEFTPPNTALSLKKDICGLTTLDTPEVYEWTKNIRNVIELCK